MVLTEAVEEPAWNANAPNEVGCNVWLAEASRASCKSDGASSLAPLPPPVGSPAPGAAESTAVKGPPRTETPNALPRASSRELPASAPLAGEACILQPKAWAGNCSSGRPPAMTPARRGAAIAAHTRKQRSGSVLFPNRPSAPAQRWIITPACRAAPAAVRRYISTSINKRALFSPSASRSANSSGLASPASEEAASCWKPRGRAATLPRRQTASGGGGGGTASPQGSSMSGDAGNESACMTAAPCCSLLSPQSGSGRGTAPESSCGGAACRPSRATVGRVSCRAARIPPGRREASRASRSETTLGLRGEDDA